MATPPNPLKNPPVAPKGDPDFEALYPAVGLALNTWEHTEGNFAHLFGTIIRPIRNSYAARRAFGSIASSRARREMLSAVAEVFFLNFPNPAVEKNMGSLLKDYGFAGTRRNELAHGIVGSDVDRAGKGLGYFIVPSVWITNKRGLDSSVSYRYSTAEIEPLTARFRELGGRAIRVADEIDELFHSSPKKLRERW